MTVHVSMYHRVSEEVIALYGRNISLRLTGTRYGLSYLEWDALFRTTLKEPMYGTPRCQRLRAWDVEARLKKKKKKFG